MHVLDIRNSVQLRQTIEEVSPTAVVNLAAISSVAQSWKYPVLTSEVNALPVAVMLDAISSLTDSTQKPIHFVQASSAEMFGSSATAPQSELTLIHPTNPYGASKAYGHLLVGAYRAAGIKASSAILFNHESPRRPETFVTRKITASVARISLGLQEEITLGNIHVRRDWGWAPDYAHALSLMMNASEPDDYIIATGQSHTIEEFVAFAFNAVGINDWHNFVKIDDSLLRPTETQEVRGDWSKIQSRLGWKPQKTFEEIVSSMVASDIQILLEQQT